MLLESSHFLTVESNRNLGLPNKEANLYKRPLSAGFNQHISRIANSLDPVAKKINETDSLTNIFDSSPNQHQNVVI